MAVHGTGGTDTSGRRLPDIVPFDLQHLTRLSWELGSRVVDADESTCHSDWEHAGTPWSLSIFHATTHTVLIRVRTPVGRERFYGSTESDLARALPTIRDAPDWELSD
jgi:hypothetical protein